MNVAERIDIADPIVTYDVKQRHVQRYMDAVKFAGSNIRGTVLDAACGTGYGSALLKMNGARYVVGVDISGAAIATAERCWPIVNQFLNTNILDLTRYPQYDLVVSIETVEHLERTQQCVWVDSVYDMLKPGGVFVMTMPVSDYGGPNTLNPFHLHEPTAVECERLLERSSWKDIGWASARHVLTTGAYQRCITAKARKP